MNSPKKTVKKTGIIPSTFDSVRQIGDWRGLIEACADNPNRKRVHVLRSLTLRADAQLELRTELGLASKDAAATGERWRKAGRKLRKALQPVRDADVFLGRLESLRGWATEPPAGKQILSKACVDELKTMRSKLRRTRKDECGEMQRMLAKRSKKLRRIGRELES